MSESIYEDLKAAGVPMDNHESDLYAKVTPESSAIVAKYEWKDNVKIFTSQIDHLQWYDIPFAYSPWWQRKMEKNKKQVENGRN